MSSASTELANAIAPLFVTRDPFIEARRLNVVLQPVVGSPGRYGRARGEAQSHPHFCCRGWIEYDPSSAPRDQAYVVARAVLICVLSEADMLRGLPASVSFRALAAELFSVAPCGEPQRGGE